MNNNNRERDYDSDGQLTRLAQGTEIRGGDLVSRSDVRIDGFFDGKVETKGRFLSGQTAVIKGDIYSSGADLSGKVEGNIYSCDCVTLKADCIFCGVLNITKLCIEKGASFNGTCRMITKDEYTDAFEKVCGKSMDDKDSFAQTQGPSKDGAASDADESEADEGGTVITRSKPEEYL